jgi:hypothetical protein
MGPSLAESWSESPDGLVYEFKLRRGLKFHNGDPITAEDVKFSFERYKGASAKDMQARVQQVEVVDPLIVRFHLKEAWPDFLTFYGTTATAAGLVVPKKYLTQVGEEGFRKHPIGAGPYKFVSHTPGVEVVLEAYTGYWRKVPFIKRVVMKSVPEGTTRVAMLKKGEADIAYALDGPEAEDVGATRGCRWWPRVTPRCSGSSSPTSGIRSRRGPTSACARPSTRARPQGHQRGRLPGLLSAGRRHRAAVMEFALQVEPLPTTGPRAQACWPRPAIRRARRRRFWCRSRRSSRPPRPRSTT